VTLILTLDQVKVTSVCAIHIGLPACTTSNRILQQYRNMAVWNSCNIDIPRSLNLCDSFLKEGNSKIGLRQARSHTVTTNDQFWPPRENGRGEELEKCNFRNFRSPATLTLTLDRSRSYRCAYLVEVYPHTKLHRNQKKNFFCGWKYLRKDGRTWVPILGLYIGHRLAMT